MSGFKFMRYVLLAAASAFCQAYGPAWTKSGTITIGTNAEWANYTGGAVANFPLMVKLDAAVFTFAEAKAGGADIGFADAANTAKLAFEIESWDAVAGKATIWVKVPSIAPNTKSTIKMFWGNAAATSESNGAGVFGDNLGVWHLSDGAGATVSKDASGHGAVGTIGKGDDKKVTADASVVSVIPTPLGTGLALNRDSLNQGFNRVDSTKIHLENKSITVSAWIKRDIINHPGDFFVAQGTQDPHLGVRLGFDYRNKASFGIDGGIETSPKDLYTATLQLTDWHYWVGTFETGSKKGTLYMDGAQSVTGTFDENFTGRGFLDMGFAYGPSGEYFHPTGGLDEVRVDDAAATADFVKLSYLNQKANQTLAGFPVPTGCVQSFSASGPTGAVTEGATVTLQGTAKCAERFGWFKVEGANEVPVESQGTKLEFKSRVLGTTNAKYRFKAMFNGAWQQSDVNVTINEAIPEPVFTIAGSVDKAVDPPVATIYPVISNLAAIKASSAKDLTFTWHYSGLEENTEYLSLAHNSAPDTSDIYLLKKDGYALVVPLCIENGGPEICQKTTITPAGLAVRPQVARRAGLLELSGSVLTWKADAVINVWDLGGKLVFSRSGTKGQTLAVTPELARVLFSADHVYKVIPAAAKVRGY